jgi:hypothetical protein
MSKGVEPFQESAWAYMGAALFWMTAMICGAALIVVGCVGAYRLGRAILEVL